jgi:hypothetical protein
MSGVYADLERTEGLMPTKHRDYAMFFHIHPDLGGAVVPVYRYGRNFQLLGFAGVPRLYLIQTSQSPVAVYKQQRRWGWGVENVPYILMACVKNKAIPLKSRLYMALVQIEGFWSLSTHPFIIFFLSWLPVILGGYVFNTTILSYNLPTITRSLVHFSSFGLIFSAIVGMSLLPKMPDDVSRSRRALMLLQWLLVPITILFFSALPGLESQTRLMLGRYMGFWVTPKHRVERPS